MAKFCKNCGSKLIHGKCPVCEETTEDSKNKSRQYRTFIGLVFILCLSFICNSSLREDVGLFFLEHFHSENHVNDAFISDKTYNNVTYPLASEGDNIDISLCAGNYVVGQDIPEGSYKIINKKGFGAIWIDDEINNIHISESLNEQSEGNDEYFNYYIENVRLYKGAVVTVFTNEMQFLSNNGQTNTLIEKELNPLTDTFELDHTVLIGTEIPAGTYDIIAVDGEGSVESDSWEFGIHIEMSDDLDAHYEVQRFNNVELNKNSKLSIEDLTVKLVPSQRIRGVE